MCELSGNPCSSTKAAPLPGKSRTYKLPRSRGTRCSVKAGKSVLWESVTILLLLRVGVSCSSSPSQTHGAPAKRRDEVHEKAINRCQQFFIALQQSGRDWLFLGTTKTGLVCRLKGNRPQTHE